MGGVSQLARVFSEEKTLDSATLNRLGVQPFRALVARAVYSLRRSWRDPSFASLVRTGLLVREGFLGPDDYDAARREAEELVATAEPTWVHEHGTTTVRHYSLAAIDADRFPHLASWRGNQEVMSLASGGERRRCRRGDGGALVEHVTIGDYSVHDPQTDLHVDTFFNTHKVWLYLDEVSADNAPLVYVPGSHRLDRIRLGGEYRGSTTRAEDQSRRVDDAEVRARHLERRVLESPANTLVMVNTCGYHCRSVGQRPGATRLALHMSFRANPFAPTSWSIARLRRAVSRAVR